MTNQKRYVNTTYPLLPFHSPLLLLSDTNAPIFAMNAFYPAFNFKYGRDSINARPKKTAAKSDSILFKCRSYFRFGFNRVPIFISNILFADHPSTTDT